MKTAYQTCLGKCDRDDRRTEGCTQGEDRQPILAGWLLKSAGRVEGNGNHHRNSVSNKYKWGRIYDLHANSTQHIYEYHMYWVKIILQTYLMLYSQGSVHRQLLLCAWHCLACAPTLALLWDPHLTTLLVVPFVFKRIECMGQSPRLHSLMKTQEQHLAITILRCFPCQIHIRHQLY